MGGRPAPSPALATTFPPMLDADRAKALRKAGEKVRTAVLDRDQLIKEAVVAGGTYREVGEAVGLSHTAIAFIVRGR